MLIPINQIHRAKEGDQEAVDTLFCAHRKRIYAAALRECGNHHTAEDAVHEVYLVARRNISTLRTDNIASWFWGISRRVASAYREKSARLVELDERWHGATDEPPRVIEQDTWDKILSTLAHMPDSYRELIQWRIEGKSTSEMAQPRGVTTQSIHNTMHRAIRMLRRRVLGRMRMAA